MKNYKWIVTDLDGTLILHKDEKINVIFEDVVEELKRVTIDRKFSIATGRHYKDVLDVIEKFGIYIPKDSYVVGANGCQIYSIDQKQLILNRILEDKIVKEELPKLISFLNKTLPNGTLLFAYGEKEKIYFLNNESNQFEKMYQNILNHEDNNGSFDFSRVDDVTKLTNITKFCIDFLNDIEDPIALIEAMRKISDKVDYVNTGSKFVEIIIKDISKATALSYINENFYKISTDEIIVFGDSGNDVEMMDYAGTAVTRDDAREEIKQHADLVFEGGASKFVKNALVKLIK
ncbi:MAG: HAD-IIB family hydrolase [Mycoplasmataceae bacterium]|nr:HAD-IIB family hydrolase [Mycoplasmataceae bacterium]